jgi:hypothetical protein
VCSGPEICNTSGVIGITRPVEVLRRLSRSACEVTLPHAMHPPRVGLIMCPTSSLELFLPSPTPSCAEPSGLGQDEARTSLTAPSYTYIDYLPVNNHNRARNRFIWDRRERERALRIRAYRYCR